ncbi:MAG: galactokinase family protein [Gemmatimonadaceae bacterium]
MSESAAEEKARLFARARAALDALRAGESTSPTPDAYWVPGRIEFLGKHTDYAGGHSLLCTVERGICLLAIARPDRRLRIVDAARPADIVDTAIDADSESTAGHWSTYPAAVARRIALNFGEPLVGADIAFVSDLPLASGLSSSSALVVATFLALSRINDLANRREYSRNIHTAEDLAGYLGAVENGRDFGELAAAAGVGTFGGSEDHTAILCSTRDSLVDYGFCPVRFQARFPLPPDHEFVIASSGIVAEKIGAARDAYNRASLAVVRALELWNRTTGRSDATLAVALDSSRGAIGEMRRIIADEVNDDPALVSAGGLSRDDARWLMARVRQFHLETELIPQAGFALSDGALLQLGAVVDRSQLAAERDLGNQIPVTIWLARDARLNGATAASAFGAGFGGSVYALVRSEIAEAFCAGWSERYREMFPDAGASAMFFRTRAGPPAVRVTLTD